MLSAWDILSVALSGIGVSFLGWCLRAWRRNERASQTSPPVQRVDVQSLSAPARELPYSQELGGRLNRLRKDILCADKRQFANLLGINQVTELEGYEAGRNEFPMAFIDRLEEKLCVNRSFLERGDPVPFNRFDLRGIGGDEIGKYLTAGHEMFALGGPGDDDDREIVYFAFADRRRELPAVILSDVCGRLNSTGGGLSNIRCALGAFVRHGNKLDRLRCYRLNRVDWKKVERGEYYDASLPHTCRVLDFELQDALIARGR